MMKKMKELTDANILAGAIEIAIAVADDLIEEHRDGEDVAAWGYVKRVLAAHNDGDLGTIRMEILRKAEKAQAALEAVVENRQA